MKEKNDRLLSIDAARGFDMMFIMGMAGIIVALCKLFPEGGDSWLALQMKHVKWEGFRHHDTIFALFLFLSGMTIPFSIGKKISSGQSKSSIVLNILRRGLTLFVLGMIYGGLLKLEFSSFRIPSVLGRIGVAWMIAALLYVFTGKRFQWITAGTILVGYFILLKFCIAPDAPAGAGTFSLEGNIASYIDRLLIPNHIYKQGIYDPEGIVGTIPAVATALLGLFTGRYVKESGDSGNRKTIVMLVAAAIMIVITLIWSRWCPVIKALWTSTFVLAAAAYSLVVFAIFYYLLDVRGCRKGVLFFQVIGLNSITIYMAQRIFDFWGVSKFFLSGLSGLLPESAGALLLRIGYFAVSWLFLYFLYKKNVFLKV